MLDKNLATFPRLSVAVQPIAVPRKEDIGSCDEVVRINLNIFIIYIYS